LAASRRRESRSFDQFQNLLVSRNLLVDHLVAWRESLLPQSDVRQVARRLHFGKGPFGLFPFSRRDRRENLIGPAGPDGEITEKPIESVLGRANPRARTGATPILMSRACWVTLPKNARSTYWQRHRAVAHIGKIRRIFENVATYYFLIAHESSLRPSRADPSSCGDQRGFSSRRRHVTTVCRNSYKDHQNRYKERCHAF
jgi:hypothetical protein